MATAHVVARGPIAGVSTSCGNKRLAVTIQGDGVSTYDLSSQRLVQAWALGSAAREFAGAAVYDAASKQFFAALAPGASAKSRGSTLLAWAADSEGGSISKLASQLHLPAAVHCLLPLDLEQPKQQQRQQQQPPQDGQQRRQQHQPDQQPQPPGSDGTASTPMEIDASGQQRPTVAAVYTSGGVALCSGTEIVLQAAGPGAAGCRTLAAALDPDGLTVVRRDNTTGSASACTYALSGSTQLEAGPTLQLAPPAEGCRTVAAACSAGRTAVLWSDGTLAVYRHLPAPGSASASAASASGSGSSEVPAMPLLLTRRLRGLRLTTPKGQAGKATKAGKKRGQGNAAGAEEAAGCGAALVALEGGLLAVVGWSTEGNPGSASVRVVVLDQRFGCVQACQDIDCGELGLGSPDQTKPLQATALPPFAEAGQLALVVGAAAAVLLDLRLQPPTLANLVGALSVREGQGERHSPFAAAAAKALAADELATLSPLAGDGPRLVAPRFQPRAAQQQAAAAGSRGGGLTPSGAAPLRPLVECDFLWQEVGAERLDEAEASCSQALADPGHPAGASEAALLQLAQPLLDLAQQQAAVLSPRLVARLLLLAADKGWWRVVGAVLNVQRPGSLAECPGLAAALAQAHQYSLLHQLLVGASDMGVDELADVLRLLLAPPANEAAKQAQREYLAAARQAAEQLVAEAEQLSAASAAAEDEARQRRAEQAAARQQQQQQEEEEEGSEEETEDGEGEEQEVEEEDSVGEEQEERQQLAEEEELAADAGPPPEVAAAVAVAACAAGAVDGFSPVQFCLHPLLAARHDAGTLLGALRQLSAPQAVLLLRYLLVLLRNYASTVGDRASAASQLPSGLVLPGALAAVECVGLCLDANMSRLILREEAAPVLRELRALVGSQLATLERMAQLKGVLQHVRSGLPLPRPRLRARRYTVEWLDLRVLD